MPETLSPHALCSLADAQAKAPAASTSSGGDADEWTRLVNAASDSFLELSGREIKPESTAPAARVFSARELIRLRDTSAIARGLALMPTIELEIGDAASLTAVTVLHADGSSSPLTLGTDFWTLPLRRRYPWEPLEAIGFSSSLSWSPTDTINVTGVWGFPAVPQDIREAVARSAAAWFARDTRRYGEVFSAQEATGRPDPASEHRLPRFAYELAIRYRRQRFG